MKTSARGLKFIETFEGFRSEPYDDVVGKKTIGIGHLILPNEKFTKLTYQEALDLLREDVIPAEAFLNGLDVDLHQNQFDALVSFAFNLGVGALRRSTLLKRVLAKDDDAVATEFMRWVHAGGKRVRGLVRRREAEALLYRVGVYPG